MANRAMAAKVKRASVEAQVFHAIAAFPEYLQTVCQPSKAEQRALIEASDVPVRRITASKRPKSKTIVLINPRVSWATKSGRRAY